MCKMMMLKRWGKLKARLKFALHTFNVWRVTAVCYKMLIASMEDDVLLTMWFDFLKVFQGMHSNQLVLGIC